MAWDFKIELKEITNKLEIDIIGIFLQKEFGVPKGDYDCLGVQMMPTDDALMAKTTPPRLPQQPW